MCLKELKKLMKKQPSPISLISNEGDIYLCQINDGQLLTINGKTPAIFHSISEAKDYLGEDIAKNLELVPANVYDEMIFQER